MGSYVALLRGIGPGNPNMRNEKLREVFLNLGFNNVRTVISTGNVLFDSPSSAMRGFEARVEEALPRQLGFNSATIIRSKKQLQGLVDADPFGGEEHTQKTNLNVTFLKRRPKVRLATPFRPDNRDYTIVGLEERAICSVIDLTSTKPMDLMAWLDKQFGKEITTRTYRTVQMILKKLNEGE